MALELQRGRSKWWYGRVEVNGRKIGKNLGVEVRGIIPASLAEVGDAAFERSRAKAQAALEKLQLDMKKRGNAEELVQMLHEIRTGARISSIPINEVSARWCGVLRRRPLSESYQRQKVADIDRFVRFLKEAFPAIREMAQIHSSLAKAYCRAELARGVAVALAFPIAAPGNGGPRNSRPARGAIRPRLRHRLREWTAARPTGPRIVRPAAWLRAG